MKNPPGGVLTFFSIPIVSVRCKINLFVFYPYPLKKAKKIIAWDNNINKNVKVSIRNYFNFI